MKWTTKITGIYFYGSLHIGLGACFMTAMTIYLLGGDHFSYWNYIAAVFFGTVSFYAFHRMYDLDKLSKASDAVKYKIIRKVYGTIRIIFSLSVVLAAVFFFFLEWRVQLILLTGSLFTIWYSFPIGLRNKMKLREIPHVKIFVIAILWGMVTAVVPGYLEGLPLISILWIFVERSLFIFALTLPFDIRDYLIDHKLNVKTIPAWMGKSISLRLSVFIIVVVQSGLLFIIYQQGIYSLSMILTLIATNLITSAFVAYSSRVQNDYYFTGILDGMLILQPILIILLNR